MDSLTDIKLLSSLKEQESSFKNSSYGQNIIGQIKRNYIDVFDSHFSSNFLLGYYRFFTLDNSYFPYDYRTEQKYIDLLMFYSERKREETNSPYNIKIGNEEYLKRVKQIEKENDNWLSNLMPDFKTYLYIGLGIAGIILFNKIRK